MTKALSIAALGFLLGTLFAWTHRTDAGARSAAAAETNAAPDSPTPLEGATLRPSQARTGSSAEPPRRGAGTATQKGIAANLLPSKLITEYFQRSYRLHDKTRNQKDPDDQMTESSEEAYERLLGGRDFHGVEADIEFDGMSMKALIALHRSNDDIDCTVLRHTRDWGDRFSQNGCEVLVGRGQVEVEGFCCDNPNSVYEQIRINVPMTEHARVGPSFAVNLDREGWEQIYPKVSIVHYSNMAQFAERYSQLEHEIKQSWAKSLSALKKAN